MRMILNDKEETAQRHPRFRRPSRALRPSARMKSFFRKVGATHPWEPEIRRVDGPRHRHLLEPFRMHTRGSGCGQADRQDHRENSRHGGLCRALNRRGRPCERNTDTTKDERKQMNKKTNPARGRALPALSMSLLLASMAMTACSTVPPQQRQEDIRACARLGLPAGSKENINCMILQQHNRERNVYR